MTYETWHENKNHTHVKKVYHTSEFPFGIYWWALKNQKKSEFWKNEKNCWRFYTSFFGTNHFTYDVYQKPQSYEVQFLRYRVRQLFFVILGHFLPFKPTSPSPLTTQKNKISKKWKKGLWRWHHFKLVQQKTQSNYVCLLRYGVQQT